jgi:hypothetical protein
MKINKANNVPKGDSGAGLGEKRKAVSNKE